MAGYFAMCCYLKTSESLKTNIFPPKKMQSKSFWIDLPFPVLTNIFQYFGRSTTKQKTHSIVTFQFLEALKHRGDRWVTVAWTNVKGCTWFIESPPKTS